MRKYCRAYYLKELRQFPRWAKECLAETAELSDETVCYLWDDFTVVKSPIQEEGVLFAQVTPAWQAFCQTVLQFELPADLQPVVSQQMSVQDSLSLSVRQS